MKIGSLSIAASFAVATLIVLTSQRNQSNAIRASIASMNAKFVALQQEQDDARQSATNAQKRLDDLRLETAKARSGFLFKVQSIVKAKQELEKPNPGWRDEDPFVDVPKSVLPNVHIVGYQVDPEGNPTLSEETAAILGMSSQERDAVNGAIKSARKRYLEKDRELMERATSPRPSPTKWKEATTYIVPPYSDESRQFEADYLTELQSLLGPVRADLVMKYGANDPRGSNGARNFTKSGMNERGITFGSLDGPMNQDRQSVVEWVTGSYTTSRTKSQDQPWEIPAKWQHLLGPDLQPR